MNFRLIKHKNPVNDEYKVNIVIRAIASGLFTGYIPVASGTFGAFLGMIIFLIPGFEHYLTLFTVVILTFIIGAWVSEKMRPRYGDDPPEVVIDEICGVWFTYLLGLIVFDIFFTAKPFNPFTRNPILFNFLGLSVEITHKRIFAVVAFLMFRFFDITKFQPAKYLDENMKSGWGIMLDDIVAGFYAGILAPILTHFLWFRIFIHKL
jgi:phosphatidylglycerophosphatase A